MTCLNCPSGERIVVRSNKDGVGLGIILGLLGLTVLAYYVTKKKVM